MYQEPEVASIEKITKFENFLIENFFLNGMYVMLKFMQIMLNFKLVKLFFRHFLVKVILRNALVMK